MEIKIYNKSNFHSHTFCIWKEVKSDKINDLAVDFTSKSGSRYIYTETGVYRISNHWGRAANCRWRLLPLSGYKNQSEKIGFALWSDFYPNDESSKLFYINVNLESREISFHHKYSMEYDGKSVIRNAKDTAKNIKIIRQVLSESDWAKYLVFENFEKLQTVIIEKLIYTEKSFIQIKKEI